MILSALIPFQRLRTRHPVDVSRFALLLTATLCLFTAPTAEIPDNVTSRNFFGEGFTFDRPVQIGQFPGMDSVYLVAQQFGGMKVVLREGDEWVKSPFDSVSVARYPSRDDNDGAGLLGFTFHPDYKNNGKYYILYNQDYEISPRPGTLILAERTADVTRLGRSDDPERVILSLEKPRTTHDGGTMRFGENGNLYVGLGDGGNIGSGDPENRAQSPDNLFGKILRVDVDGSDDYPEDSTRNYAIPEDNPFVGSAGYSPEIWALGLRNPWRWDFHPETGEIWLGDVGHASREEITRVPKGGNLGWRIWEGTQCFRTSCPEEGMTEPVMDYGRSEGFSVTGGVFFNGEPEGAFDGLYIFGDYGTGSLWALREEDGEMVESAQIDSLPSLVSINKDSQGRVFVLSLSKEWNYNGDWVNTGTVRILESPDMVPTNVNPAAPRLPEVAKISPAEVLNNREDYVVRGVDGRMLRGKLSGMLLVRKKNSMDPPQLVTILP